MAITAATRTDIIELVVLANGGAPGVTLLSELVAQIESGKTLKDIATTLTTSASFKAVYPTFATPEEFANEFLDNIIPGVDPASKAEGVSVIVALMNSGATKADILVEAAAFLGNLSTTDASFGGSAALFQNQVAAATYHTVTKELDTNLSGALSGVTSDPASVTAAKTAIDTPAATIAASKTMALTTGLDTGANFTGGSGDDTFTANATSSATTTTFTTGDSLVGGEGTDRLTVAISDGATSPSSLVATSGIEELSIFNNDSGGFVLQGDLMDGLTDIFVTAGQDAITVDQLNSTPNLHLTSTNVDATLAATTATVAGTADAITIASNGVASTASVTATFNGIETINLVGSGANTGSATTALTVASDSLETVNVTGSTNMYIVADLTGADNAGEVATFNASAATGNIDATLTAGGSTEMAVTMGSGDDVITLGAMDKDYTVDGGAGTDRIETSAAGYSTTLAALGELTGRGVTNVEVLGLTAGGSADLRAFPNNTFTSLYAAGSATFTGLPSGAASLTARATGSLSLDRATDGSSDSATISLLPTTPGTFASVDVADEETVTLSSSGVAAGSNVITTLTATDTTSLTISGNRDLTITNAITGTALATLNASGLTGQGVNLSVNASNSLAAMTVTAGAGSEATAGETMNTITTGSGADTVTGGDYKDIITTGAGNDSVTGGAGNDTITTSFGNDYVDGGNGDDTITDSVGNDTLIGGAGNDTIDGAAGADSIDGGAGNDKIYITTLGSNDTIIGGTGTDVLSANAVTSTVNTADFVDLTESSALNITGVETAYIEVNAAAIDTTTAPLNVDFTGVTGLTTLNLDVNVVDSEAMKITNFGGSSIVMTGLAATEDPEFVNIDGAEQSALTLTVRGFAPATAAQADMTVTGVTAFTLNGDSYLSTSAQTNRLGSLTADSVDTLTISSDGSGSYAANGNALLITNTVSATNAQTVNISVGAGDTIDIGTADGAADDITTSNSLVQTATISVGENGTLTVGGGDVDFGSSAINTLTVTTGIGATISAMDIEAGSAATTTVTLGASSSATLDLNYTITSGTVAMSTGSSWTVATLGKAATASSISISGYGDVAEGTSIALAGSTFTFNAGALNDSDGLTVTAAALTGIATITGSTGTDAITGSGQDDVISGGNGADTIDGGDGIDTITLTETVSAADEVILTSIGATNYANIIGYVAGTDDIQVPDATHALFGEGGGGDTDGSVAYIEAATIKAAKVADDNFTFAAITTAMTDDIIDGFVAGTKTEAELEAAAITALGLTGGMTASDIVVLAVADNEDTALFLFTGGDAATDDAVDAAEIQLLGIIQGLDDVTDLAAGDFLVS
jgi:Ca2+-binding RTX toxin-like protein